MRRRKEFSAHREADRRGRGQRRVPRSDARGILRHRLGHAPSIEERQREVERLRKNGADVGQTCPPESRAEALKQRQSDVGSTSEVKHMSEQLIRRKTIEEEFVTEEPAEEKDDDLDCDDDKKAAAGGDEDDDEDGSDRAQRPLPRRPNRQHRTPESGFGPDPEAHLQKMERRWALPFAEGSVRIGSLSTTNDPGPLRHDRRPTRRVGGFEVTEELLRGSPLLRIMTGGNPPPAGTRLCNEDNRRLVFCASASASIPPEALPPEYDTWVQIEAAPAIELIHQALLEARARCRGARVQERDLRPRHRRPRRFSSTPPDVGGREPCPRTPRQVVHEAHQIPGAGRGQGGLARRSDSLPQPLPPLTVAGLRIL